MSGLNITARNLDCLDEAGAMREPSEPLSTIWPTLPANVVKSAGRVLQILEFFDDIQREANAVEVSRALNFPQSSTSVLLRSLVALGYLHYDTRARAYCPTSRVSLLGNWIAPPLLQGGAVLQLMRELNEQTADAVLLAARNGLHAQYIHVVQATTALRLHVTTGTVRPLVLSAAGLVFLSALPEIEVAKLVRRTNAYAKPGEAMVNLPELLGRLEAIRRDGYCFWRSLITPGTVVLAMPLPAKMTQTPLVLAIGGPTERMESRRDMLIDLMSQRIPRLTQH